MAAHDRSRPVGAVCPPRGRPDFALLPEGTPMSSSASVLTRRAGDAPADLHDSVALVTGAGRGIGRAVSTALADSGAAVALRARWGNKLDEPVDLIEAAGGTAAAATADVTDPHALTRAVRHLQRRLGPIDLLVNN